jgi:transposase-like protein
VKINGKQHYLWRAVDQDGEVVDVVSAGVKPRLSAAANVAAEMSCRPFLFPCSVPVLR